ncbi:MAG: hypothetical protein PHS80_10930 [Methanothrix sp.]|nr:hypothetical protein [Methanothrix sp.]MDD4448536.1 hypothetical protein [Methanothrix sp.]
MLLIVATVIVNRFAYWYHRDIALNNFSKRSFNPGYNLNNLLINHGIFGSEEAKSQNVVVFGDYYPFLGAGDKTKNWNFVVDSTKKNKIAAHAENIASKIEIGEIYNQVYNSISKKNLPNISLRYILFADGNELDKSKFLLSNNKSDPVISLDENLIFEEGHKSIYNEYRTYIKIEYLDKVRTTLFSTFLRFSMTGDELFGECNFHVLPPIDENKYNIDRMSKNDIYFMLKFGVISLVMIFLAISMMSELYLTDLVFIVLFALILIPMLVISLYYIKDYLYKITTKERVERGEPHNYGKIKTFREMIAKRDYKNYYSAQDIIMIQNSIEQTVINSIADLLDLKGIDSSILREDVMTFVNQGIMMFGGKLNAENISIGSSAKIINQIKETTHDLGLIK